MGFASSSCSFSRFRIIDQATESLLREIPERLLKFAFRDIEEMPEMTSHGWVCFEDLLDSQWETAPPLKGDYAVFSLRLDTRKIPAGVIKKHLALAIRDEKARLSEAGKKFISRERKKELKELVMLKLRRHFLPVPAEFNVIWNLGKGEIWFASVQSRMIDLFMEYFLATFELHIEQLTPYNLATAMLSDDMHTMLDAMQPTQFVATEIS